MTMQNFIKNNLWLAGACLLNLAACLLFLFRFSDPFFVDIHEYLELAANLVNGNGYSSGGFFHFQTFPSAFLQPVYAYLLAFFIKMSGLPFAYLHIRLLQIAFSLLLCLTIYLIGLEVFNKKAALCAAYIYALYVPFIYQTTFVWDTLLFSLQLAVIVWLALRFDNRSAFPAVLLGLLLGLTVLTNSVVVAVVPFLLGYILFANRHELPSVGRRLLVTLFCLAVVVAPWSARNSLVFKAFVPVRTGFWLNLYLGNNEDATGTVFLKDGRSVPLKYKTGIQRHFGPMARAITALNEFEQDRYFKTKFFAFVFSRPRDFFRLLPVKLFYYLWFNPFEQPFRLRESQYLAVVLLALGGFWAAVKEKKRVGLFALVAAPFIITYTLVGPFFNWKYRMPIEPYFIVLAGYCVSRWLIPLKHPPAAVEKEA